MILVTIRYALSALLLLFFSIPASARELVFAPLPIEQPEAVINASRPLVNYLSRQLGVPIRIGHEASHQDVQRQFKAGKIDIIHTGPLPYLALKDVYGKVEPIVAINEPNGRDAYTCAFVTSFDGPTSVAQIRGPIALTQALSTCGYLTAGYLLQKHGKNIEKVRYAYLGNQDKVAQAVLKGTYQVGTMKTGLANKYNNMALRVIEETPLFPGFLLVANTQTMSPELIKKARAALLTIVHQDRETLKLGQYGFSPVDDRSYDLLRKYQVYFR